MLLLYRQSLRDHLAPVDRHSVTVENTDTVILDMSGSRKDDEKLRQRHVNVG